MIAGVPKGGTTSLFHYLGQHDEVCGSDLKELYYFQPLADEGGIPPPIEEYARHFRHWSGESYRMEASPSYCYSGDAVIQAIRSTLGSPRVLISLREPTERFWSAFRFLQSMGRLDPEMSGLEFIDRWLVRHHDSGKPTALTVGRYIDWLGAWIDEFGDDLRIVFAERLFEEPSSVVNGILSWLGLDPLKELNAERHNPTTDPRSHRMARVSYRVKSVTDDVLASVPWARRGLRTAYRAINTRPPQGSLPDDVRARLTAYYSTPTAELADLLTQHGVPRLPAWLAEDL